MNHARRSHLGRRLGAPLGRRHRDRGAALVEFAIVAPMLVLLIIGGIDLGLATVDRFQLQAAAQLCADSLAEDDCGDHASAIGGTLECFQATTPHCYTDGLDGLQRVTVKLSSTYASHLLPDVPLAATATGRVTP